MQKVKKLLLCLILIVLCVFLLPVPVFGVFPPQGTGITTIDNLVSTNFTGLIAGNGAYLVSGNSTSIILTLGFTPANQLTKINGYPFSANITLSAANVSAVTLGGTSSGQYAAVEYTCSVTLNWNNSNVQRIVLANGAQTFTFANPLDGGRYALICRQPLSGVAGTVSWPATVLWPGGTAPTLSTSNNSTDVMTFIYDNTNTVYYGGASLGY